MSTQSFLQLTPHPTYYINGGDAHFLAGNQLFRVHRYFFERESRIFAAQLGHPASPGAPHQGVDDSSAIVLEASPDAFQQFLGIFYNPKYSLYDYTVVDWTSILDLAQKWEFKEVKNLAIRELETQEIPIMERIALYQKYAVDSDLLVRYYMELCRRPQTLTEEDSEAIGLKTAVLIFRARERLRAQPSDEGNSPLPAGLEIEDVRRTILNLVAPTTSSAGPPVEDTPTKVGGVFGARNKLNGVKKRGQDS